MSGMPTIQLQTAALREPARRDALEVLAPEPRDADAPALDAPWHVVHTRSRQEKAVARALHAAGIAHYLPLMKRITYHGHRKRTVLDPLFASYIFLQGPTEAAYFALSTRRVVQVLPVPDQMVFDHEIQQIRAALDGGAELDAYDFLTSGRAVRVTAGPFRGIEGLIEDRPRADRLVLQVAALGRATSLEIDISLLEPVD